MDEAEGIDRAKVLLQQIYDVINAAGQTHNVVLVALMNATQTVALRHPCCAAAVSSSLQELRERLDPLAIANANAAPQDRLVH